MEGKRILVARKFVMSVKLGCLECFNQAKNSVFLTMLMYEAFRLIHRIIPNTSCVACM